MENVLKMVLYLHDVGVEDNTLVGANYFNRDPLGQIDEIICQLKKRGIDVVLSADDGYKSIFLILPILEKYKVRLICFITAGFINGEIYPYEVELSTLLQQRDKIKLNSKIYSVYDRISKERFFLDIHKGLKLLNYDKRLQFISKLVLENDFSVEQLRSNLFLTSDELLDLSRHSLVEIGDHSFSHLCLTSQKGHIVLNELYKSKRYLTEIVGKRITKLSYPYGANNPYVRTIARFCGYESAFGTHTSGTYSGFNLPRYSLQEAREFLKS
ncbi:polysaccharide deacetylase family protein [Marinoscillum sp.]|uniref:polysaccharide deacetylase family protein n=1 Tax=Marinoscillum sp. TaxID=2024838 RepID=UPI003BAA3E2A